MKLLPKDDLGVSSVVDPALGGKGQNYACI